MWNCLPSSKNLKWRSAATTASSPLLNRVEWFLRIKTLGIAKDIGKFSDKIFFLRFLWFVEKYKYWQHSARFRKSQKVLYHFSLLLKVLYKEYVHLERKIEPNWLLPYSPCQYDSWGMPGGRAGSPFSVYVRVQCREPKTGQKRFNSILWRRLKLLIWV